MKRQSFIIAIAAMAIMGVFNSCQKEKLAGGTFSATMEQYTDKNTKVVYENGRFGWQLNDEIRVYRELRDGERHANHYGLYKANQIDGSRALFGYQSGNGSDVTNDEQYVGRYYAFSPSSVFYNFSIHSTGGYSTPTVQLPAIQTTDNNGNLLGFPMYTESAPNDQHLQFRNLCGLMKLSIVKENCTISAISVTTNSAINGQFDVDYNAGDPTLTVDGTVTPARKTVTLNFGSPQSINTARDFYIALPEANYTSLEIKIFATNGTTCTKSMLNGTLQINRSKYTVVNLTDIELDFVASAHPFTINPSGDRVLFAPANLQAVMNTTDYTVQSYQFATNEWDTVGPANRRDYVYYRGVEDLLYWGTEYNNMTIDGEQYRMLSADEWNYLLFDNNGRSASTVNGVDNARYCIAVVNGVKGMVIFPDTYTHPEGVDLPTNINSTTGGNNYSGDAWAAMKAAGVAFLPDAGSIRSSFSVSNGRYWCSDNNSIHLRPFTGSTITGGNSTHRYAIRLVKTY